LRYYSYVSHIIQCWNRIIRKSCRY